MTSHHFEAMNQLEIYLADNRIDPIVAMNTLQDYAVVSDNAVMPADVATIDAESAVKFLRTNEFTL